MPGHLPFNFLTVLIRRIIMWSILSQSINHDRHLPKQDFFHSSPENVCKIVPPDACSEPVP